MSQNVDLIVVAENTAWSLHYGLLCGGLSESVAEWPVSS